MIESILCFYAQCDGSVCGAHYLDIDGEAPQLFPSESELVEVLRTDPDWTVLQDLLFCPEKSCQEEAARARAERADRLPAARTRRAAGY